jgi:hypothetical protein
LTFLLLFLSRKKEGRNGQWQKVRSGIKAKGAKELSTAKGGKWHQDKGAKEYEH